MIDLHSHLLEDLDKTPYDIFMELKKAKRNGLSKVVFTPRVDSLKEMEACSDIKDRFDEVVKITKDQHLDIELMLGAEVSAYKGIVEDLSDCCKELKKRKYILIDVEHYRNSIDELAYGLKINGITPIFTKVEYTSFKKLTTHTDKWKSSGAQILVTAPNLFGQTFEAVKVRQMLRNNQIDYISSGETGSFKPYLLFKFARWFVTFLIGPKYAKKIFSLNARDLFTQDSDLEVI